MMGDADGEVTFTLHVNDNDPQSPDTEGDYGDAHRDDSSSDDTQTRGGTSQSMALPPTLSYDSSPRESDDMLGYESWDRESDDMLGYESSAPDPESPDEESPSELERQRILLNNYVAAHRNVSSSDDAHSHGDSHDTQPMAPLATLSYDSSPRESDDMLGYESSARASESDDMLGYEISARESDDMQDGDPSPREDDGEVQMTQP